MLIRAVPDGFRPNPSGVASIIDAIPAEYSDLASAPLRSSSISSSPISSGDT
jgi:hypothetical protein